MKKIVRAALLLALVISMTGCASMLKSMGGVSKAEMAAYQAATDLKISDMNAALAKAEAAIKEIDDIKATLAKLSADLSTLQMTANELKEAKAMVDSLLVRVEQISDETLLKLAQLIQKSLAEAVPAQAEAPAAAPAADQPPAEATVTK
jgi:small-conductance mechanosensitive channel